MKTSKRTIYETLKTTSGFEYLTILSNINNYQYFLERNYQDILENHQQLEDSWNQMG